MAKKPVKKEEIEQVLTDREYFEIESHQQKIIELELRKTIKGLERQILQKNVIILKHQLDEQVRKQDMLIDDIQVLETKRLNTVTSKDKVTKAVSERLQLDTNDWGYNPETLEII